MPLQKLPQTVKVGIGWFFVVFGGLYSFYLSKQYIDKNRYESMKVRERLRKANLEEYTPSRNFSVPKVEDK